MLEMLFPTHLHPGELLLRVGLAMLFGMLIGLDRETKGKPIDFRAFMIVAVGSCIIAILGQDIHHTLPMPDGAEGHPIDQGKIFEGVLTGIGFLGAGAIIKQGGTVIGTATGSCIWACGAVGLALGYGFYDLALVGFLAVLSILVIGGRFRAKCRPELGEGEE